MAAQPLVPVVVVFLPGFIFLADPVAGDRPAVASLAWAFHVSVLRSPSAHRALLSPFSFFFMFVKILPCLIQCP